MYESPITLFKTDPLIQRVKDETGTMIFQAVARVGVHVDKDELIKALEYDRGQYEKGFHDGRMYVPPCPSKADRIRAMTDEELAEFLLNRDLDVVEKASKAVGFTYKVDREQCLANVIGWLKEEAVSDG